jgi:excinuclease UvrABC ATPase subunit
MPPVLLRSEMLRRSISFILRGRATFSTPAPLHAPQATSADAARPKIVVIAGPTASGKSSVAMAVCAAVGGEIVSADSVQIYRGLDVGANKVNKPSVYPTAGAIAGVSAS